MKRELIDILCCPMCKSDLILNIVEENNNDIIRGTFRCERCSADYPIENGIPNLLPKI